jgi:hypothetical protein
MKNKSQLQQLRSHPMFIYLMILTCTVTVGFQGWRTLFNNFAVDIVNINAFQVGIIQSLRELPGFLSLLVVYLLFIIKEEKLAALSVILLGIGTAATGYLPSFTGLIFTTLLMSTGMHYFETVNKSLVLQHFDKTDSPLIFGAQKSWTAIVNIIVGIVIMLLSYHASLPNMYLLLGVIVFLTASIMYFKAPKIKISTQQKKGMVFRKKYALFYILNFLSGARRQIFVVFAVFILVQRHHFSVLEITLLFIFNNMVTYFVAPLVGKYINRYGERRVLAVEYIAMTLIFAGYAFIDNAIVVAVLYILDNIFYSCAIGINTYFHKIASPKDIAPSMAVGFTINHISAVVIPAIGGALWMLDYKIPFITGLLLSLASLYFISKIKTSSHLKA